MPVSHVSSILVVDDHPHNLIAIRAALSSVQCELVTAESGFDALRHVLAQDFAVIILDIQMPIMDGFETASLIRARQRSRTTPIMFLTAYDPDGARKREGYRLGAVDYLYTPVDPDVLRSKVTVFVELFSEAAAQARRTAELNDVATNELRDINGRVVHAGLEAMQQAEVNVALRSEAESALILRDAAISKTALEVRTPVLEIKTGAQLALRALADVATVREQVALGYLRDILANAERLLLLTTALPPAQ